MQTEGLAAGAVALLDYLYWLRDRVLATAEGLEGDAFRSTPVVGTRDLRGTLAHELDVEWSWRRRLREEGYDADAAIDAAEFPELGDLAERWRADEAEMRAWLSGLAPADLGRPVARNNLEGFPLGVYLVHVVEHGVLELGAAAAILHQLGRETGELGFLNAIDDLGLDA